MCIPVLQKVKSCLCSLKKNKGQKRKDRGVDDALKNFVTYLYCRAMNYLKVLQQRKND